MEQEKKHSQLLIDLILSHLKKGTLTKSIAMKLLYELQTSTIEEFAESLNKQ